MRFYSKTTAVLSAMPIVANRIREIQRLPEEEKEVEEEEEEEGRGEGYEEIVGRVDNAEQSLSARLFPLASVFSSARA